MIKGILPQCPAIFILLDGYWVWVRDEETIPLIEEALKSRVYQQMPALSMWNVYVEVVS